MAGDVKVGQDVQLSTKGIQVIVAKYNRTIRDAGRAYGETSRQGAITLQGMVREAASGPPGPNIRTGRYWQSIQVRRSSRLKGLSLQTTWSVVTEHPAARRLENGYVGRDAMGRVYAQPPLPHWRPATARFRAQWPTQVRQDTRRFLKDNDL